MRVAVCCIVKNTPDYVIRGFVNNYLEKGAQDIYFIIDEGSKPIFDVKNDKVKYLPIADFNPEQNTEENRFSAKQLSVYNRFLNRFRMKYDWIALFDDDELISSSFGFLNHFKDYSAVYIPCKDFVTTEINAEEIDDFYKHPWTQYEYNEQKRNIGKLLCSYKSIINTKKCKRVDNVFFADFKGVTFSKKPFSNMLASKAVKDDSRAFLNHYVIRGFNEWLERIFVRGDIADYNIEMSLPQQVNRKLKDYFDILGIPFTVEKVEELIKESNFGNKVEILDLIDANKHYFGLA